MSDEPQVLVNATNGVGRLTLNRPAALHALTTRMCELMTEALLIWRDDAAIELVVIDHSGDRGFCAGGDIRMLAESGAGDGAAARRFFFVEYRLNELLFRYPKPVMAIMDGVTMGGGVGLSLPARYRVATERTSFAMPETGIGLFPDVGGGWHLPRLHGQVGLWLALTGARLRAADCLALGIATDVVESGKVEALKAAPEPETLLTELESDPGPAPVMAHRDQIDRLFGGASVEAIFEALAADGSDWATAQLATLKTKSPQTLKVAFRQLRDGAAMQTFAAEMAVEYRLGARIVQRRDFLEGVRAVIVEKDNAPQWSPATLAGVTDAMLDGLFAPLPPGEEWMPLPG
ncbi:MAG TPA: enoyl-CoA hydratase/isomerase family protein [Caulobacteraceae bacterium]|nr:enoyl-CoA hydratase/isomerase family protein [Caulobacteraceae bacterium]